MGKRDRRGAEKRGRRAEKVAIFWLRLKGYSILAERFRCALGEIDIIARRGQVLAFIEVKQRPTRDLGQSAVPHQAWQRIGRAAQAWGSAHPQAGALNWRYDLIVIVPKRLPKHFRDYWRP